MTESSSILAHRGLWFSAAEKNHPDAIVSAFAAGYGVETDVRDLDGELVLAHDPARAGAVPFQWVIQRFAEAGQPGWLAINIKADGLQPMLADMLAASGVTRAFVFDASVPDALGYLRRDFTTFTRHSELEPVPAFYDRAAGVWMDCFEGDWIDEAAIRAHLDAGKMVALVSPELHGRPHHAAWAQWRGVASEENVLICTDLPREWQDFCTA